MLRIDILTIFPSMLEGYLGQSMMKRAVDQGAVEFNCVDIRDYATDKHRVVDDRPFGGGPGMIMMCGPIFDAIEDRRTPDCRVLYMSPAGAPFTQKRAEELGSDHQHLIFLCGHYEGVDQRVIDSLVDEEVSIGDYVLTNGVLPAAVISDAIVRLLPGVLGGEGAAESESHTTGRLEGPQYTRPAEFRGMGVPEVLFSGHHKNIQKWHEEQSIARTRERRPDLLD